MRFVEWWDWLSGLWTSVGNWCWRAGRYSEIRGVGDPRVICLELNPALDNVGRETFNNLRNRQPLLR